MGYGLVFDRAYGKNTFNALQSAGEDEFIEKFLEKRKNFFLAIVKRNPSQKRFIRGWLNRIE
jgi:hypothetical protein